MDSCALCSEQTESAVLLICLHSYCAECIKLREDGTGTDRKVLCVLCGTETRGDLEVDMAAANVERKHAALGKGGARAVQAPPCSADDHSPPQDAVQYCAECAVHMCEACSRVHSRFASTRGHQAVRFDAAATSVAETAAA
jgi:hypothetical protein